MDQLTMMMAGLPSPPSPPHEDGAIFATSVTGLVTYAGCPRRFYWSEVDRLPRRPSAAARRGVEVHRRIELHNRGAMAFEEADESFYDLPPGEDDSPGAFAVFRESRFAAERPLFVEAPFDLKLDEARIRGRVDAIYGPEPGLWELVDFKSGTRRDDPAQRVQLEAYALAATEVGFAAEPPARLRVTFAYLGSGLEEVTDEVDDAWLAGAAAHLVDLTGRARAGMFDPTPSAACRGCDFLRFCEAGQAWAEASP